MDALSPVFAAFGFIEHDALNDLACWLDGRDESEAGALNLDWRGLSADPAIGAAGRPAGREG